MDGKLLRCLSMNFTKLRQTSLQGSNWALEGLFYPYISLNDNHFDLGLFKYHFNVLTYFWYNTPMKYRKCLSPPCTLSTLAVQWRHMSVTVSQTTSKTTVWLKACSESNAWKLHNSVHVESVFMVWRHLIGYTMAKRRQNFPVNPNCLLAMGRDHAYISYIQYTPKIVQTVHAFVSCYG